MTQNANFTTHIFSKDKKLKINTLSPNGRFFFKIKEPKDLYWGLFVSPIAFFDIAGNLIYYNQKDYVQYTNLDKNSWTLVTWSSSGNFAFFIERHETKTLFYVLLDLENKKVSKTEYLDKDENKWTSELFSKLPQDKAQDAYYKIKSTPYVKRNEVFDYVLTLNLIDDKRELIKALDNYYDSKDKKLLREFEKGNFNEKLITGSSFDNFKKISSDKLNLSFLDKIGLWTWRP